MNNSQRQAPRYQDFVIRDGEMIGDWEGLYKTFDDPWNQSRSDHMIDSRRLLAVNWCRRLREQYGTYRAVELGCGFGHLTETLRQQGFSAIGVDISSTAVKKAREVNPASVFLEASLSDFDLMNRLDPDIYLMAEITWYVLDDLSQFLAHLKRQSVTRGRPVFLVHLLATYAPGVQKYGVDRFTNLDEILSFFDLNYLEAGFVRTPTVDDPLAQGTYFIAKI